MPVLSRDGVSISYSIRGDGFPILLSHGFASTALMWRPQVPVLSARYKLVTWDMRGHGGTDSPSDPSLYSEAASVGDMLAVLDAVGAQQAIIGGLSLGGYLSLAFHYTHPERCRALVLCDTGPGYRNPAGREDWNRTAEQRAVSFETQGLDALGSGPEVQQTRAAQRSAQGLAHAARGLLKQFDARIIEALPRIAVPVLVVAGANDTPFLAGTDYMAARIPGARKVIIPDAGHASNLDQPERFNHTVLDFLDGLGLPSGTGA